MKVKSLLAAIIASGYVREGNPEMSMSWWAEQSNDTAEEILKLTGDDPNEELFGKVTEQLHEIVSEVRSLRYK